MEGFPFPAINGKRCGSFSQGQVTVCELPGDEAKPVQGIAGFFLSFFFSPW